MEHGRAIYDNAPEGAKLFYQRGLGGSEYSEKTVYDHYRTMGVQGYHKDQFAVPEK